jgi:hypothetical protein
MPTFATDQDAEHLRIELERRVREAWTAYRAETRELEGPEYVDGEAAAWDRLQRALQDAAH